MSSLFDFEAKTIQDQLFRFADYKDQPFLIVNTARKCGFAPQMKEIEDLHQTYKNKGLMVIAFPCNQFGSQEPGSNEEIAEQCDLSFHTTFQMMSKIDVNGTNAHPLYQWLTAQAPGLFGSQAIKWNFTKFLIDRSGKVVERFSSMHSPEKLRTPIENLL
jgi:glutathione peroxidase